MDVSVIGLVLAISPHLDDAALSAGNFLTACSEPTILTVFAGTPDCYGPLTPWDAMCGFVEGSDVVAIRRDDDRRAAAILGATPRWLSFLDRQYVENAQSAEITVTEIAREILDAAEQIAPDAIAFPLGIQHEDHRIVRDACLVVRRSRLDLAQRWFVWCDVPYRAQYPQQVVDQVESLQQQGFHLAASDFSMTTAKRAALAQYASQFQGLGESAMLDAEQPEVLYEISIQ